jgi:hypothetical protein
MISTGELMLGKAMLTVAAVLGFCIRQLLALRRLRRAREQGADTRPGAMPDDSANRAADTDTQAPASAGAATGGQTDAGHAR